MKERQELINQLYRQKDTIAKLQETNNFQKFDLSELRKEVQSLKKKLKCRKDNIRNVRAELMKMKRKDDFSNINSVLAMLNEDWEEDYE
jgi:flagellar biosynthesis/type III secretory pathway chaperone